MTKLNSNSTALRTTCPVNDVLNNADPTEFYEQYWLPVAGLFNKDRPETKTVEQVLWRLLTQDGRVKLGPFW